MIQHETGGEMDNFRLSKAPLSTKLFVTTILCVIGLIYLVLVVHIWIDTELKPSMIAEAYGGMEYIELTDHAHVYFPYYTILIFAIPVMTFLLTSYNEKVKSFFAVFPFVIITLDIASMYLIPYLWKGFAMILWLAGTTLGTSLLVLFFLILYDVWLRKVQ
jgi:hypothetical protein